MPPKKEAKKATGEAVEGEDPVQFLKNYTTFSKNAGLAVNPTVKKELEDEEKYPIEQLVIDDELGQLGPGGTRALMTALMGSAPGMKGGPYKLLKSLRLWRCHIGDDGTAAVAEVLRLGGAEIKLCYLELLDNGIGALGGMALGMALSQHHNLSLLTLKLDFNTTFGARGCAELCKGLRTNSTLKQLYMKFCNIEEDAGVAIGDVLANARSALEVLDLGGNRLRGAGLQSLCRGLRVNRVLKTLSLADNGIDQDPPDLEGLGALRDCLLEPTLELTSVDLLYNRIGEAGALVLAPALTPENKKIGEFLVDLTLPMPIFEQIFRRGGGKKKGKKGKKK